MEASPDSLFLVFDLLCWKDPNLLHLQEDFDIFLTPNNYEDPKVRKQFQEYHITAYENTRARGPSKSKVTATPMVANDPDGKTKNISTEAGLRRLARQLQRTEQELWADLALRALGVGKVDKALKILRSGGRGTKFGGVVKESNAHVSHFFYEGLS